MSATDDNLVVDEVSDGMISGDSWGSWGSWKLRLGVLGAVALLSGLVLRFWTRSELWLDEALSVNIARLPLGEIPGALRKDGHPPLFYVLLHAWMSVFGEGNAAVRAFSGMWSVAFLCLLWVAARRLGGTRVAMIAVMVVALNPWAIRYATETRMYAMVATLTLAGWILGTAALRRPTTLRLAGLSAITAALLWTHYWSMWLLGTVGLGLLVRWWSSRREQRDAEARSSLKIIGAIVVGGLLFLPWVPALLYQGAHTGTPWARPMRPAEILTVTIADFGGGPLGENVLLGWILTLSVLLGLFGLAAGRMEIALDLRTRRSGRALALLAVGPLAVGCVVGYLTGATYASRYAAVVFPFFVLLSALGLSQIRDRRISFAGMAVVVLLSGFGAVRNVIVQRTSAKNNVAAITAVARPGDWIVYCPDQLGPAASRLVPAGFEQVTYPDFGSPQLVDWVDYKERIATANPEAFADRLLKEAGNAQIFLMFSTNYVTHESACPDLLRALGAKRPAEQIVAEDDEDERSAVIRLAPA